MIREINIWGIYIHPFLIGFLLAFLAIRPANYLLNRIGLYKHVSHPGLFDTAMFFIMYAICVAMLAPDMITPIFHLF